MCRQRWGIAHDKNVSTRRTTMGGRRESKGKANQKKCLVYRMREREGEGQPEIEWLVQVSKAK